MTDDSSTETSQPQDKPDGKNRFEADVAIVGGGLVGATMAALLSDLPLQLILLDEAVWPEVPAPLDPGRFDARVSALSMASRACFEQLGVWEGLSKLRCCPFREMEVWDADGTGRIHFEAAELQVSELGTIAENSVLLSLLREELKQANNLRVCSEQSVRSLQLPADTSNGRPRLRTASGLEIEADLVIAADGGNSPLRQLANFSSREWDYGQMALVTTVRSELPHGYTAWQRFLSGGPLAFLPLLPAPDSADQQYSSIVWSLSPERAQTLLAMPDEAFRRELGFAFEHRLGEILDCDERRAFPLRQRHATTYVKEGIALIGDAAHTIHPLAGQGVNLGILDAQCLAGELARGLAAGRRVGDARVLSRYQRGRIGHNLAMMGVMEGFKRLFASDSLSLRWLRNRGMDRIDRLSGVKNQLARQAMGL